MKVSWRAIITFVVLGTSAAAAWLFGKAGWERADQMAGTFGFFFGLIGMVFSSISLAIQLKDRRAQQADVAVVRRPPPPARMKASLRWFLRRATPAGATSILFSCDGALGAALVSSAVAIGIAVGPANAFTTPAEPVAGGKQVAVTPSINFLTWFSTTTPTPDPPLRATGSFLRPDTDNTQVERCFSANGFVGGVRSGWKVYLIITDLDNGFSQIDKAVDFDEAKEEWRTDVRLEWNSRPGHRVQLSLALVEEGYPVTNTYDPQVLVNRTVVRAASPSNC